MGRLYKLVKTTIEISDALLARAKRHARKTGKPLRVLVEEGIRRVLEEQDYTVYRDFRSWTGALTFRVRHDANQPTDYSVAFTFSFKAYPRFPLGGGNSVLTPYLNLDYVNAKLQGFTETGLEGANLTVFGGKSDHTFLTGGAWSAANGASSATGRSALCSS